MLGKQNIPRSILGFIFALSILASCTTIHIQNAKEVRKEWGFGITRMSITQDNRPIAINTQGLGLVTGYSSVALGWLDEEVVVIPDPEDCHAIFINKTVKQTQEIRELLEAGNTQLEKICFTPTP